MEIWALCPDCGRWFYIAGGVEPSLPGPTCPVCGAEPSRVVNRASAPADGAG